ncbi:MAG: LysR substrate-binding domain-containing protein [Gammaproteobacteria bacterium]|nr:LysR substrate-binding domain-containing protein [Gammaproteobacteria bacterium]
MNLRDLRYLAALARYKHFGKAAEACFVTQPTLSAQIKKLEQYLGVPLVERNRRNVRLTEVGELIAQRAAAIDAEAENLVELAKQHQDPLQGRFRLGVIPTSGPYLLPLIMKPLEAALPRVNWVIEESQTSVLQTRLSKGELDACILATESPDGCDELPLFDEPFWLALPQNHALGNQSNIKLDNLSSEPLLLLEEGHCLRDQALAVCDSAELSEHQEFRATSLETLRHMTAAGAGLTLLPELAIKGPWANLSTQLQLKPLQGQPSRSMRLVWRNTSPRTVLMQAVVDAVQAAVEPVLGDN